MLKTTLFWILATFITISAVVYQKTTGPTYPKKVELTAGSDTYEFELIRSHGGETNCPLVYTIADTSINAVVKYRKYPTNDDWTVDTMLRDGDNLTAALPHQPPAGKVEYKISFYQGDELLNEPNEFHTVVRFKGDVPTWVLYPHIFFIFFAMLLSNLTAIFAMAKKERTRFYGMLTLIFFTLGGMVFGPIVQLYAFGDLWTGIPFGWDLTDNKTLIAFVMWIIAVLMNRNKKRYGWYIAAAIAVIIIFSIPHSMFGSELDYSTGTVTQG